MGVKCSATACSSASSFTARFLSNLPACLGNRRLNWQNAVLRPMFFARISRCAVLGGEVFAGHIGQRVGAGRGLITSVNAAAS